jgi:hypothetical protein
MIIAGANLQIMAPENYANSAATIDATQTLTNKSIVSIEVNGSATASLTSNNCSNTILNNFGQTAICTLTLPVAIAGLSFVAICGATSTYQWKLKANTTNKIYLDGIAGTNNQCAIVTPTIGNYITFATFKTGASTWDWLATTGNGTWTAGA